MFLSLILIILGENKPFNTAFTELPNNLRDTCSDKTAQKFLTAIKITRRYYKSQKYKSNRVFDHNLEKIEQ